MKGCEQTKGLSVLDHGESVKTYLFDLLNHLRDGAPLQKNWRLPDWLAENREFILSELPDDSTLELYTVYHDIGKPHCLSIDESGKRHFPNHAEISYQVFNQVFDNPLAADLIRHDMDVHLLKADGVEAFCKSPNVVTLLITGLSEIHSNADMFGGIESTSFKIKWKCLNQRGKQIFSIINKKPQFKMKTQEQKNKEAMTYLEKTSKHIFLNGKETIGQ